MKGVNIIILVIHSKYSISNHIECIVFTGSSLLEQKRYAENLQSIEAKLRKKTIFVPTIDEEVKLQVDW